MITITQVSIRRWRIWRPWHRDWRGLMV